jgi:diaminohydroxyphosphoribosylaminopyrimidine deaminase/5-amino-6-(5-phosphoribosylamino)uracil reductase
VSFAIFAKLIYSLMEAGSHQVYMQRCIELARLGAGYTAPNPLVGAVIVHRGLIIGEGYHQKFGEPHAEVNAIRSIPEQLLPESTLYVNLEPCSHHGKTPPCADLIISRGIKKVVIGSQDPNPLVAGKGIEKLKAAGVEVIPGICEEESKHLNRRFFCFIKNKRPYIILKYARSADGFISYADASREKMISGPMIQRIVHQWRSREAAIMVGTNTAVEDNPNLNARMGSGPDPVRITFDRNYRIPSSHKLFNGTQETLIFTSKDPKSKFKNVKFIELDFNSKDHLFSAMHNLYERGIQSVLVEGGSKLLNEFYNAGLWDESRVITAPVSLYDGVKAPEMKGRFDLIKNEMIGPDMLSIYKNLEPA